MDESLSAPPNLSSEQQEHDLQLEANKLSHIKEYGAKFFPGFPVVDTSEYDSYKPEDDQYGRGQILYLTTEEGRGEGKPELRMIFRPEGLSETFTFGTSNTPEPEKPYSFRNVGDSFYGPNGRKWRVDEIDLAMQYGKIRMEGIDIETPEFQNQFVGWLASEDRFITMKEALDGYQVYLQSKKKNKDANYEFFNLLPYGKERELVLARLMTGVDSELAKQMIERFKQDPEFADSIMRTETTKMNAHISLLADRRKLPPVALCETDYSPQLAHLRNPMDIAMMKED